jgi:hypothetical protein
MRLIYLFIFQTLCVTGLCGQASCASPAVVLDGGCTTFNITNNSGAMLAGCNGGNHPLAYLRFTAPSNGDCVQINFSNITSGGTYQLAAYTAGCASYVTGSAACVDNVVAGNPFSFSGESATGANLFTPGATYVLAIQSNSATSITACMNTPSAYASSDECAGAQQIGTGTSTLYNGGDCQYSGSVDNPASTDPPAIQLCAGSLENTQWTSFIANATSIQIIGSSINCTGGGCGFQFGMFTGSCGSLTNIGCYGNKVCTGGQSTAGPTNPTGQVTWSGTSTTGFTATISGLVPGQTVYLAMDGNADADCQYNLTGVNVLLLPVEYNYFRGVRTQDHVVLEWQTATEINCDYFEVQKSTDNQLFTTVLLVNGAGTSSSENDYKVEDVATENKTYYYRLKQYDFNGEFSLSSIIAITNTKDEPVVLRRISLLGEDVEENYYGIVIEILSDNTVRKKFNQSNN